MATRAKTKKNMVIQDDDVTIGDKFVIPPITWDKAIAILQHKKEDAETVTAFPHEFLARPWDGAYATAQVIKRRYGISFGKGQGNMFFSAPPELRTIKISATEKVQIPWGIIELPSLDNASVQFRGTKHADYGVIFHLTVNAFRMHKAEVDELFSEIEEYLKEHSIYKGKAIVGYDEPDFLDLSEFQEEKVVYTEKALRILNKVLFYPLQNTEKFRAEEASLKRAVLLFGPYGTGKTLTGQKTAKIATDNGWTFVAARPGRDNLEDIMRTARLYMPSVVFYEDVDTVVSNENSSPLEQMLDVFDGITAKGGELMAVMTTNHESHIRKSMLRPGRLDGTVRIAGLDRSGIEKLIRAYIKPGRLDPNVDFDEVYKSMSDEEFMPAFVVEAINRALSGAISHSENGEYSIGTEDLVTAADSLAEQLKLMNDASERTLVPPMEKVFATVINSSVKEAVHGAKLLRDSEYDDEDNEPFGKISCGDNHHAS